MGTKPFTLLMLGLLLTGCSGWPAQPENNQTLEEKVAERGFQIGEETSRTSGFNLRSWDYLDSTHIIVRTSVSRYYLVHFRTPCHSLRFSSRIGYSSYAHGSLSRMDQIYADRDWRDRCSIKEIFKLEPSPSPKNEGDGNQSESENPADQY